MNKNKKLFKSKIYLIVGVTLLILAIAGSAYAYYQASATAEISGAAAGSGLALTVNKISTGATGDLIPIDMDTETLTNGAKGWHPATAGVYGGDGNINNSWAPTEACRDKNGYSVCQIYSVTLNNNASNTQKFDIGVTSLSGTNTPNIEVVKMASNISVTSAASIKGVANGIASDVTINSNATSTTYYFMVLIKNLDSPQNDNGSFSGTVTAVSSAGAELKANFGDSDANYIDECCFDAGSQVLMANGTTKNIEDVKVGDYVMSYDTKTGEYAPQKVTNTIIKHNSDDLVYLNLSNGVRIGMRAYHPMLTVNGWKSLRPELAETISDVGYIQKLELNDTLIGINKNVSIVSIDKREPIDNYDTYNFTVDNFHTYIVNGVVVHNASCPTIAEVQPTG